MTLSHAVVAWVQASELSNTAALPRACAASSPCSEANAAAPTTPPSRTVLPVAAVAEALCSAARSMPGTDAGSHGKAHDGSPCGNLRAMGGRRARPRSRRTPRPTRSRGTASDPAPAGRTRTVAGRRPPSGACGLSRETLVWKLPYSGQRGLTHVRARPCGFAVAPLLSRLLFPLHNVWGPREYRDPAARRALRQVQELHAGR